MDGALKLCADQLLIRLAHEVPYEPYQTPVMRKAPLLGLSVSSLMGGPYSSFFCKVSL